MNHLENALWTGAIVTVGALAFVACGSSGTSSPPGCVAGQSVACVGVGGCQGGQVCKADGTFDACLCGAPDSGLPLDSGGKDAVAPDTGADGPSAGDGGSDVGSDSSATFTPATLAGLVVWLKADVGVTLTGASVVKWKDQSLKGNDLTGSGGQTVDSAVVGGHDAIHFTGSQSGLAGGASGLDWGTSDYVIAVTVRVDDSFGGANTIWVDYAPLVAGGFKIDCQGAAPGCAPRATGETGATATAGPYPYGAFHVIAMHRTGGNLEIRVDGIVTSTTGESSNANQPHSIGVGSDPRVFAATMLGDIAEVVVATSPSVQDVTGLEGYMKKRYGL